MFFWFILGIVGISGLARGITNVVNGEGIAGFFKGFVDGVLNTFKIPLGIFAWDSNLNLWDNIKMIVSRFTWELPQTVFGMTYNLAHNLTGQVNWVKYKYGATVVNSNLQRGGIALGPYITGNPDIEADPNNPLFQHEYGHVLQSRAMGWAYLPRVGIPSIFDNESYGDHDFHPVEQDANYRAFMYFNKHVAGFYKSPKDYERYGNNGKGWNFYRNPLDPFGTQKRDKYWDFNNEKHLLQLSYLKIRPKWYDYVFFPLAGFYNAFKYNNHK